MLDLFKNLPEGKYELEIKNAQDIYIWKQEKMMIGEPPKKIENNAKDIWLTFQDRELIITYQVKAGDGAISVTINPH